MARKVIAQFSVKPKVFLKVIEDTKKEIYTVIIDDKYWGDFELVARTFIKQEALKAFYHKMQDMMNFELGFNF